MKNSMIILLSMSLFACSSGGSSSGSGEETTTQTANSAQADSADIDSLNASLQETQQNLAELEEIRANLPEINVPETVEPLPPVEIQTVDPIVLPPVGANG